MKDASWSSSLVYSSGCMQDLVCSPVCILSGRSICCAWSERRITSQLIYCVLLCRKQPTKARLAAAAQSKQQLTLVLMKCLPDLLMHFQADAVKVQHNFVCI